MASINASLRIQLVLTFLALILPTAAHAAEYGMANGMPVNKMTDQPDAFFQSEAGQKTVDHIVSWQNADGGWWKGYDASKPRPPVVENKPDSGPKGDNDDVWHLVSTIDNNATWSELRIVARAYRVTKKEAYKESFNRGLKFLFDAQYENGGWPQRFPLQNNYGRFITYNDGAMIGVMRLMQDVAGGQGDFAFVSEADRKHAKESIDKGIDCILKTQIRIDGKPTVWGQQHDEKTFAPAHAREYELPSLYSSESAGIVLFLMDIEKPDAKVREAIDGAVAWFESSKITGKRIQKVTGSQYEGGKEVLVVDDPAAPALWARFYDLKTGKPFFCSRDGVPRDSIDQISHERRVGYAWYGNWGDKVIKAYAKWQKKMDEAK